MNDLIHTRRKFLGATVGTGLASGLLSSARAWSVPAENDQALIAITLDLEMSRNFPEWNDTHWDYEKGNLNEAAKAYTVEACRRVKRAGGVLHCFSVCRVFEQENVDWLQEIVKEGHPVGNHTYDHVNVLATRLEDVQFRFKRAPWLVASRSPAEVIRDNIRLAAAAMKTRLGVAPVGFRTPGGFAEGLRTRPDVRRLIRDEGYPWVSSLYPPHMPAAPGVEPDGKFFDNLMKAQAAAQPFRYPDGLIEIPMSPISDIGAFRTGRWRLEWFLEAVRLAVGWAIERRAVFDFLAHPSCLGVVDPKFETIDLICDLVRKAGDRARIVGLETIARRIG